MIKPITQLPAYIVPYLSITSRIVLAILGSYAIAVGISLAFLALPMDPVSAIYWGQTLSVAVCAATIIFIFSTRTALRAWVYVSCISSLLFGMWSLFG